MLAVVGYTLAQPCVVGHDAGLVDSPRAAEEDERDGRRLSGYYF